VYYSILTSLPQPIVAVPAFLLVRGAAQRHAQLLLLLLAAVAALGASCDPPVTTSTEISRERAIEIARKEVSFQADSVDAVQSTLEDQRVWRVTFKGRLPDQPPGLFETVRVDIDARTGEIVSASRP
jgi:uncharacterized membrane protein YkoI